MADNPIKRLRDEVERAAPSKAKKANHTLYLNEAQFQRFKRYCDFKHRRPSEMVDRLIGVYLDEVKDDMPAKEES